MTRMLVAIWPEWPVVAAGYPPDVPAAVVVGNHIQAVTAAARHEGVTPGLRRREAQRRCPELEVVAGDPGRDARAWEPVVAAVETMAPLVEVMAPGCLALATRGPSRYFGGDVALAGRVQAVAEGAAGRNGCRVGVADGHFAAALAAVGAGAVAVAGGPGAGSVAVAGGPGTGAVAGPGAGGPAGQGLLVVAPGGSRAWLAPQPVSALGPDYADLADLLVRLGIRTLGELAALPARAVLGRFGPIGQAAHRLARGRDNHPFRARQPPPELACQAEFDPPEMRAEAAAFVAKALADELHARLDGAGLVCTKVAIEVETEHGETRLRHWRHEGALDAQALAERARWQLDGWLSAPVEEAPSGGLTLLRLTPEEVRPDSGRQLDFWGGMADVDARAARAMARVQGMLGPEAVATAVLIGGRGPAEQVRLVPWGDDRAAAPELRGPRAVAPWPGRLDRPSPAVVHDPPAPVDLLDAGGGALRVSGRGALESSPAAIIQGPSGSPVVQRIVAWAGPWPAEERWWDPGGRRRARLQLLLEDGSAHLVYQERGRWWLEGTYG